MLRTQAGDDWEKLFDEDRHLYHVASPDRVFFESCRSSRWLKEIITVGLPEGPSDNVKVLEAGCANAKRAIAISTFGPRCVGLDYALAMCQSAERLAGFARGFWKQAEIAILQGNILSMPFDDDAFDLVYNNGVLEHFQDTTLRNRALAEMVRVTRPGGRVLVTVPNGRHVLEKVWHKYFIHEDAVDEVLLSGQDLAREMTEAGLTMVWSDFLGVSDSFDQWLKFRFMKLPILAVDVMIRRTCPRFIKQFLAFHLLCVAEKPQPGGHL